MPCEIDFSENFVNKVKGISYQKLANLKEAINKIKALDKPDDAGGAYQKILWVYPVQSRSALVCKIEMEARKVHVIDIIFHL